VGIRVIVEVLDRWSDLGLTRGERDDLLVIAENVDDGSREPVQRHSPRMHLQTRR
jgi:hypothetical protein